MAHEMSALGAVGQYWTDPWQRRVLLLETLSQRGNIRLAPEAKEVPHVLAFKVEFVFDGRALDSPVEGHEMKRA